MLLGDYGSLRQTIIGIRDKNNNHNKIIFTNNNQQTIE